MRLFDLHCDTLTLGVHKGISIQQQDGSIDLLRGRAFSPWVQAFAAFLCDDLSSAAAWSTYEALRDTAFRWCEEYQGEFHLFPSHSHGCQCMLTLENGGVLGEDLSLLRRLQSDGVRMVGLTWNGRNAWGDGCGCKPDTGLTEIGCLAVKELERLNVTVDVSHLGERGFWQVAELAEKPFAASHSNARAICDHPRNLTDDQFRVIRDRGGLVGINLYPQFLGGHTADDVERHIAHFLALGGEKVLCFGADFDGMTAPEEWNGIAFMTALYHHLEKRGYPLDFLNDLYYNNAYEFFQGKEGENYAIHQYQK